MKELLIAGLALGGAGFVLIAALGVLRLPDVLCRMHAATKAGAFGATLLVLALILQTGDAATVVKGLILIFAFYASAPIAGHMLGRAIYRRERGKLRLHLDEWADVERADHLKPPNP